MNGIKARLNKVFFKLKKIIFDFRETILYLFFGVCTVCANLASYALLYECIGLNNLWSSLIAWLVAVIFAYLTNKKFVFNIPPSTTVDFINEFSKFFLCRVLTGVLDIIIMLLAVDFMNWNAILWKFISNVIVTVINYFASKKLIFTKK